MCYVVHGYHAVCVLIEGRFLWWKKCQSHCLCSHYIVHSHTLARTLLDVRVHAGSSDRGPSILYERNHAAAADRSHFDHIVMRMIDHNLTRL